MPLNDPELVYQASDQLEAEFVKNLLADAGIPAIVIANPYLAHVEPPRVFAEKTFIEQARVVIQDYEARRRKRLPSE